MSHWAYNFASVWWHRSWQMRWKWVENAGQGILSLSTAPAPSYWQRINQREEMGTSESAAFFCCTYTCSLSGAVLCWPAFLTFRNFLIYASKKAGFTWPQKEKPVLCFAFPPTHLCSCRFCAGIRHAKLVFWLLSLSFKTRGILRAFADLFLS